MGPVEEGQEFPAGATGPELGSYAVTIDVEGTYESLEVSVRAASAGEAEERVGKFLGEMRTQSMLEKPIRVSAT